MNINAGTSMQEHEPHKSSIVGLSMEHGAYLANFSDRTLASHKLHR